MTGLEHAILGLQHALDAPRRHYVWRRLVRQRIAALQKALASEVPRENDAWLAAREERVHHESDALQRRLSALGRQLLDGADVEPARADLQRLLTDLDHHRQRLNDLVYDSVSLELGGSD